MTPPLQRPALELADVIERHGHRLEAELSGEQHRIFRAIASCRTAALGGHVEVCDHCQHRRIAYNSCRNRHCPKCQASTCAQWMEDRAGELLPVEYFHVVFTLPDTFNGLALANKRVVYGLLFDAVSRTLQEIAADPRHLGAKIGFIGILHTWGQNLGLHPHVHCIVPGGGLSPDGSTGLPAGGSTGLAAGGSTGLAAGGSTGLAAGGSTGLAAGGSRWVSCKPGFFLPVRVLSKVFRGKFIDLLKKARQQGRLVGVESNASFGRLLNDSVKRDWVVYAKPPFGGPEQVLKYLSRYTHRIAISNRRLVSMDDQTVSFSYKDYAHGNQARTMKLDGAEFLRRFLMHAVPSGFMRIRHFGLFANCVRAQNLQTCRRLLGAAKPQEPQMSALLADGTESAHSRCPVCSRGRMVPGPNLSAPQMQDVIVRMDTS